MEFFNMATSVWASMEEELKVSHKRQNKVMAACLDPGVNMCESKFVFYF
jgi:hypothetical protein